MLQQRDEGGEWLMNGKLYCNFIPCDVDRLWNLEISAHQLFSCKNKIVNGLYVSSLKNHMH